MPELVRRSGRSRRVNPKYTNEGWNEETLRLLRGSSESSNDDSHIGSEAAHKGDKDFTEKDVQASVAPASDGDEDNLSNVSGSSQSSDVATPAEDDDDDDNDDDELDDGVEVSRIDRVAQAKPKKPSSLHSRGIGIVERGKSARAGVWQSLFGPEVEDLTPMVLVKDKWLYNARDIALPSWKTLAEADSDQQIKTHGTTDPGARGKGMPPEVRMQQEVRRISIEEARRRFYLVGAHEHKIVLGPWNRQQAYNLSQAEPVSLGQAWKTGVDFDTSYHTGWVVNVGEKPQCLAWSRNQGSEQYLAIACRSTPSQRKTVPEPESDTSPAYRPSASYPVGIQIWRFATKETSIEETSMDAAVAPKLLQVLACSFGDVKQMTWAPEGRDENSTVFSLGMLALVTTDGCAHIVHVPKATSSEMECLEVISSAITISPPNDNVFSCFTFASSTDLILGTSSGHAHFYNLSQPAPTTGGINPYLVVQLHNTYILSMCTPDEEYSHFLASTSASGTVQINDIRSPVQDAVTIHRARIPSRNLICNIHTRAFLTTIDSSGNTEPRGNAQTTLIAHNLRHFYTTTALARFPEGTGTATALAGSPLHPIVLTGNTGGNIWAQNVFRRIAPTAKPGTRNDGGAWIQKVVEYDWIPRKSDTQQSSMNAATEQAGGMPEREIVDLHHGPPVRPGISRMHHGFKPERLDLSNVGSKKRKSTGSGPDGDNAIQVIYEEEQAVTAMEWNPNPIAASWCAIGWGSGVVLIADLGHDTL